MILFSVPADPGSHLFGVWCCLWNTYSMLCLVRQWIPSFVRLRWFFVPVYRAATCSVLVLPEVFRIIGFYGDDFTFVFVFYAELGSTADTCTASVYGACGACVSVFSAQLGSTTDTCGASVYVNHIFPGVSVFSAQLGSTADTCGA